MGVRYEQVFEDEWEQVALSQEEREMCCDCGLVHRVRYRLRPIARVSGAVRHILEMKTRVDKKATRAYRKRHGIKISRET